MTSVIDIRDRLAARADGVDLDRGLRAESPGGHHAGTPEEVMDNFQTHRFVEEHCPDCGAFILGLRAEWPCGEGGDVSNDGPNLLSLWHVVSL